MTRLPRGNPGDELTWTFLNKLVDAIEVATRITVDPTSGLEMQHTPAGKALRVSRRDDFTWFRVTAAVGAGSGSAYGTGAGIRQFDNGIGLSDAGTATEPLKNLNEKGLKVGTFVACARGGGSWWVVVPDKCSNLV